MLPRKSRNTNNTNITNNNHCGIYNTTNTNAHHELLTQLKESPDQKESIILSHNICSYADSMIKSMSFISQRELSQIKQRKHYKTIIDINKLKTIYNDTNTNANTKSTKNVHIRTSNTIINNYSYRHINLLILISVSLGIIVDGFEMTLMSLFVIPIQSYYNLNQFQMQFQ